MDKTLIICWLLLVMLQIFTPSLAAAAPNITDPVNSTSVFPPKPARPSNNTHLSTISVAVGEPVVFECRAPEASQTVTLNLYSSRGNYSLICPDSHVEDIPQILNGRCEVKNGEILAVWTLKRTSNSDNNTKVSCQQSNDPAPTVTILHVYDNSASYPVLIGCVVGGFFGILLVFGLMFLLLRRFERFQNCMGVEDTEEDLDTIVKELK